MNEASASTIQDSLKGHWVNRLPQPLLPYAQVMRLDRPIGWWLLLLPCWWGLALAQLAQGGGTINLYFFVLMFLGAVIMRSAGCIFNDVLDRDIDAKVERTKNRPLPSGRITVTLALALAAALSLLGLVILLQFNRLTVITAIASLALVAVYPLMKRVTNLPQLVLGLAFNWGALVGWTAIEGHFAPACLVLYVAGISWTMAYDTIYAHQDSKDDAVIGVKSTALLFGRFTTAWLVVFFTACLLLVDLALWLVSAPWISHLGVAAAAVHATWQILRLENADAARCLQLFRSNRDFGLLVLAGMIAGCFIR